MPDNGHLDDEVLKSLPNGVALSWGLGKKSTRGPKGELSIPKIVDAAIRIADEEGLAAVSMNRVASSLGFTTMSLYRYVNSKDDLILLMQNAVCYAPIPPEQPDWREEMRSYVRVCIQVFRDHPWFGDVPITSVPLTPGNLRIVDWGLRSMRDFPLTDYEKMSIVLLLSGYSRSCGMIMRDMDKAIQAGARPETIKGMDYSAALKRLVKRDEYPHFYPVLISGAYTEDNPEDNGVIDDFDFGLERILDGIQVYLDRKGVKA
ncbi:TetR/AcrR family transcriptional regulator [Cohnella zeiphila]|uniref:TetR/AcrR family transcriptional regulator n=1 Tax=Cohnella zeiphila TaxID=2761120 RepID=A0A7X0VZK9_9BACL|nr:TetR/AcrR family transcriptional regulator [Cohnella zeiphila]MBB6735652.1 TetR/AcrR family transcriptional regulator [Cohnella zeiphila]